MRLVRVTIALDYRLISKFNHFLTTFGRALDLQLASCQRLEHLRDATKLAGHNAARLKEAKFSRETAERVSRLAR